MTTLSRFRWLQAALAVGVVIFLVGSYSLSRAARPDTEASASSLDRVVVFAVPELGLEDVESGVMPNLDRLARRGAIAVANVRTQTDAPNLVAAYASLGSGNRTNGSDTLPEALDARAPWLGTTAADLIGRRVGEPVEGDLAVPFLPTVAEAVVPEGGTTVGAMGTALRTGGRRTAFVGQSGGWGTPGPSRIAPGALVAVDDRGMADAGTVDDDLLTTLVDADGRTRQVSDPEEFAAAVRRAQADADLVVVDTGDTTRARAQADADALAETEAEDVDPASTTTTSADQGPTTSADPTAAERAEALRTSALRRTDLTLRQVAEGLEPGTLLLVVGVTPPGTVWGFTPIVASGPGIARGYLDSASTHRPALVTLTDLAPTILDTLEVAEPDGMIGQPLRYRADSSTWDEARILDDLIADRAAIDRTTGIVFIGAQAALYGAAALLLLSGRGIPPGGRRWFVLGSLTCAAWPVATYLLRIRTSLYSMGTVTLVLSWAIALAVALLALRFRRHPLDPVFAVAALTVGVLVVDLATGAHLQVGSFFGYMPHTAPRFTGLGNSGFAILAASAIVTVTLLVARSSDREAAWWGAAAVAVVVVAADGAPWMGSDVGGILALVPSLGLTLWALRGHRIRVRTVAMGLALGAVVLAIAVAIEALRAPVDRTHIGRFFLEADEGSTLGDTLRRKWSTNVADLGRNPLYWTVPVLVVVGVVQGRYSKGLARLLPARSPQRIIVVATLLAGVVGWLVNDSGVVVLALACVHLGALLILVATSRRPIAPITTFEVRPPPGVPDPPESPARAVEPETAGAPGGREVIVALVPAKDRADSIGATVEALLGIGRVDRVLVVDDGSSDDTALRARAAGADVLRLARNRGKGGAVHAGVARCPDATVFLLIDADLARTASAADTLLDPVLDGDADMTVGILPSAGGKAGFGTIKRASAGGIRRACGFEAAAPLSGQRAVRSALLRDLVDAERFGLEVAMTIDAVRSGAVVVEVPVPMDHRHTGRSLGGFAHRGRQGLDIVRSLWPRLGGRRLRWGLLAVAVLVWVGASNWLSATRGPATAPVDDRASSVLVVGVPYLALDDVTAERMPALARLAERGTLALATPRTGASRVQANAYATLGAGDLASVPDADPEVLDLASRAGQVAAASLDEVPEGEVIVPSLAGWSSPSVNGTSHVGALGDLIHDAGLRTGLVANSSARRAIDADAVDPVDRSRWSAPAALMVADTTGVIDAGTVSTSLLTRSDRWAGGYEAVPQRFVEEALDALTEADVVVVDSGETDRWSAADPGTSADEVADARADALATTDEIVEGLLDGIGDDTLVLVVGIGPAPGQPLVPVVLDGPGWRHGRVASTTTRQADLIGYVDVAPTILHALGVAVPDAMSGSELLRADGGADRDGMERTIELIQARDQGYGTMVDQLVWGSAVVFTVLGALFVLRWRTGREVPRSVARLGRWAPLTLAAVPFATYVVRAVDPIYGRGSVTIAVMWVVAGGLSWSALRLDRHPLDPLLLVCVLLWAVVSIDLFLGGSLQVSSYLGHTPSVGARFVGLGNAGFGAYGAAAVVICVAVVARGGRRTGVWVTAVGVAAITVLTVGLPWMGSDVGGILSLVPVLGLVLWTLRGRGLTLRSVGVALAGASSALALVVVIEAFRPAQDRTHIGRFFLGTDGAGVLDTFDRKWSVNVGLLQGSTWSWLIWFGVAFVTVVVLTNGRGRDLAAPSSPEWIGAIGLVGVGILGWVTNDSGPLVAALVLGVLAAYLTLLALDRRRPAEELLVRPEDPAATVREKVST